MSSKIFANTDTYGNIYYTLNGKLHREDGPAVEDANGTKFWYLNGKEYTEAEHRIFRLEKKLENFKWMKMKINLISHR